MIIDKFFDYKRNAFTVSAQVIEILLQKKKIKIDSLFNEILSINHEPNYELFIEALGLLHLTGKITYNLQTDNLEVVK